MGITPHSRIYTKHQKCRGSSPGDWRKFLNKLEGVMLYQKTCDLLLLIPRPLRTICKQPCPTGITPTMLLWILPAQDTTHDISNANQTTNKTDPYWKDRPGQILPPDTFKWSNCVDMHSNIRRSSLFLPVVTLWYHTRTSRIYYCQWSSNRPGKRSALGRILGHRWPKLATQILTTTGR